ncbi:hypothetical protein DV515_00007417 [Chloebia gouldiae]|uniref:Uncharacterized protein n=1 Tax=Chloebia gouldiae TaxID=44316 RepID=A0A3L8SIJ4_CHLGU|nr:hypothetical protein DV515_00007417 [Chloebia gouldiae]
MEVSPVTGDKKEPCAARYHPGLPTFSGEFSEDKSSINGGRVSDPRPPLPVRLLELLVLCLLALSTAGRTLGPGYAVEESWERESSWSALCFQTPLHPAEMEGPASTLCLRTCYIKHCKVLLAENPPELGQTPLSRSCRCSRRTVGQEWSNSVSKCALPIIPEYPGFQDVKLSKSYLGNPAFNQMFQNLERGKNSSAHLRKFPRRGSLAHCLGSCSGGCLKGHQPSSPAFQDKPLQEYFSERLVELGSCGSKRSSRRAKGFVEMNQSPSPALRGSRHGCGAELGMGKEGEEPCSSAKQHSKRGMECKAQKETQHVLKLHTGDFLDLLTMPIAAPLEALVQKK